MNLKRFVAREEYFGALVYDRQKKDYIPFDGDAAHVFRETAKGRSLDDIFRDLSQTNSEQSFQTFVQLSQSIELLDGEGRFTGEIIDPGEDVKNLTHLSAPLRVHLQLTNECQLRCKYCSQTSRNALANELTLDEIKKLIDQMVRIGVMELNIGGGEPFLRDDLVQVIAYASGRGISVSLSTSGLFISRVVAKKIAEHGLKQIRISFDGASEKSYDYLRGKGTYRRAIRGIKTLRELFDTPIILHTVVMKPNLGELLSIFRAVQKLGADVWSLNYLAPVGYAASFRQFALDPSNTELVIRTIKRFSQNSSMKIVMPQFPYAGPRVSVYRGFGCSGGQLYCMITASGDVKPCSFMPDGFISGNIRNTPLQEIWNSGSGIRQMRENCGNEVCTDCQHYNSCRGGCRARAEETGKGEAPDPYCFLLNEKSSEDNPAVS